MLRASARNITLSFDEDILREAKILAAQEGLSVSGLLRRELSRLVEDQRGFAKARTSALRRLSHGTPLGGAAPPARDELHDRAKLR
ncbi:MAG TPA: CopG family transcriptional regulator [Polyangia bacterium]|nr:CopG family transcriptional regulator [Polyangia bacterium]